MKRPLNLKVPPPFEAAQIFRENLEGKKIQISVFVVKRKNLDEAAHPGVVFGNFSTLVCESGWAPQHYLHEIKFSI